MEVKTEPTGEKSVGSMSPEGRRVDAGQELRYSQDTQDEAYKTGAYDIIETRDFSARIAVQAGHVIFHGAKSLLDIGCGTGETLKYIGPDIRYVGMDISPTAIRTARERYTDRAHTDFYVSDFREWQIPDEQFDCILWAGIGRTWTRGGRTGDKRDWLEILLSLNPYLADNGIIIIEATKDHWPKLSKLIARDYTVLAGCDVDCLLDDHRAVRSTRVLRPREATDE